MGNCVLLCDVGEYEGQTTLCGLSTGSQPVVRSFIVIAELQFLTHMNHSYVNKIIFWLC